jgi:ABC-type multidrug transport system fused ATPase/permease subunit
MSSGSLGTPSMRSLFFRFLPYAAAEKRGVAISVALVLAEPIAVTLLMWSFKRLIDDVLVAGRTDLLAGVCAIYLLAAIAKIAIDYSTLRVETNVLESINLALRSDLYGHALSLSPGSLNNHTPGDVLTRLQTDTTRAEFLIFSGPMAILADGVAAVVYVGFLFILSWQLALVALVALPTIGFCVSILARHVRKAAYLSRTANSQWMSLAEERLEASQIVHAFNALQRELAAFRIRCGKVRRLEVTAQILQGRQSALVEAVLAIAGLAVFGLGAHLISQGSLTVGGLVAFVGAANSLFAPVRTLAKSAGRFQYSAAGAERVAALLDRPSLVTEPPQPRSIANPQGRAEFRDVHFSYPDGAIVLRGLSLAIEPGETVAVVGASGSGKTSLVRLLLRQYDCNAGAVLLDGIDVRELSFSALHGMVSPVFQDAQILNGTIEKNIRYGAPGATAVEISQAARAAAVDIFANVKGRLATPVGPRGSRLSGGQRQRIGVARAIAHGAPILVLDEATAGVDSQTEELIQDALDQLSGQRTLLIVAHRLSTVRRANRVVVMDDGRIIETGRPADLLAKPNSRCRELFAAQLVQKEAAE